MSRWERRKGIQRKYMVIVATLLMFLVGYTGLSVIQAHAEQEETVQGVVTDVNEFTSHINQGIAVEYTVSVKVNGEVARFNVTQGFYDKVKIGDKVKVHKEESGSVSLAD
ncbi:hypothetical protein [Bacillus thuringiensis]|uniref:hypothetical protein n=1 Tax=Bacillus thuringiensis TaxID=1428 RepID=UPI000BFBE88F|nr:hypothetical protein [Bacillus thuringiensis]PGT89864.1 hypothetical protein COD17_08935 [Bacillus thuringiensis]